MKNRKKVLFISEAAYLNTGYAKYSKEVISRIHDSKKYDIAEFSIYGSADDPRRSSIPWKNYPNAPDMNDKEQVQAYNSNPSNQFGAWRFDRVCLDFEPDIVLTIRDFWMDYFVYHSSFRRIFSWAWMPTVDASPQNQEWIDMFSNADYILTYSDWAKKIIEQQGGKNINTIGTASPSASSCFTPMNKDEIRSKLNLRSDVNIVGTVMRNQRRKLFPALIESFGKYLRLSGDTNTFLYLHTSFPDSGWNLADLIHNNNISSRVLLTYVCEKCNHVEVSFFRDAKKVCSSCKEYSSTPSNVSNGVSDEVLAEIYNVFDIYVQCANSEGFGLPQVEAAACGIPIVCTNYSAMEDIVNKLDAYPIEYSYYKEMETGCNRAVPNNDCLVNILTNFFSLNKEDRLKKSINTRELFEKHYNWDNTANQWMKAIDSCEYADWKQPPKIIKPIEIDMKEPSNYNFIQQMLMAYNYYEPHKNSHFIRSILTDLNRGFSKSNWDGYYSSEFSPFSSNKPRPINREVILNTFKNRLNVYNSFEYARVNRSKLKGDGEKWLN
jgi:glycosyltransferase involved in cell wall biosynthesis